jgi:hypothetical protein
MIVFNVVKEKHGWSVRMGQRMTTPFWSKKLAVSEANRLADGIRRHGELTEVVVDGGYAEIVDQARLHPEPAPKAHVMSEGMVANLNIGA